MKKVVTVVLGLLFVLGTAGLALAQVDGEQQLTTQDDSQALGGQGDDLTGEQQELLGNVPTDDFFNLGLDNPSEAQDWSVDADRIREVDREVDVEEDDVFNALAISNNNGEAIDFSDIADITEERRMFQNVEALSDFEEETVFAALALGVNQDGGELESLAQGGGDVDRELEVETITSQEVDLDRDDTLLGIALANSAGGDLQWEEMADVNREVVSSVSGSQEVDLDTEDAFLALALGIGGQDGGI